MAVDLVWAIEHAFKVLDWHENLMSGELPPKWMWHLEHELELWFERVERDREDRFGGPSGGSDDDSGPMMSNEFADELRGR